MSTRRVAVVSDIHGNVRALKAILEDIARRGIDEVFNLGDCAYGPFDPRPVMDRLLKLDLPSVSGNEDRALVEAADKVAPNRTAAFCMRRLESEGVQWLARLPRVLCLEDAVLFHGLLDDDTHYLLTQVDEAGARPRPRAEVERLLDELGDGRLRRLILCGHDHTPRTVALHSKRLIVNPGSVGCPAYWDDFPAAHAIERGSPHAWYAVIDIEPHRVRSELLSVAYDWTAAAREASSNGFADWAQWIATGRAA